MTDIVTSAKVKQYKDLMKATGPELSRLLGEVLQPEHDWKYLAKFILDKQKTCINCGISGNMGEGEVCNAIIPLTPAEAFKYWVIAIERLGIERFHHALYRIYKEQEKDERSGWAFINWLIEATPERQLRNVALTVLGDKK